MLAFVLTKRDDYEKSKFVLANDIVTRVWKLHDKRYLATHFHDINFKIIEQRLCVSRHNGERKFLMSDDVREFYIVRAS